MPPLQAPITKAQLIAPTNCKVGENPLWHPGVGMLFFLDIPAGIVHQFDPRTGDYREFSRGPVTGGMTLQEDGSLLLFQDGRISVLGPDGVQRVVATDVCPLNERFNDVIADPEGRVYAGAMGGNGRLLRFDLDGSVTELFDDVEIPNGMGFTPDCKQMYFTDSMRRRIYLFDYDRESGNIGNRRIFAEIPREHGVPDGMTVDANGFVWTCIWGGGRITRLAPDGSVDREIFVPAGQITAIAFGGSDLGDSFITSASVESSDAFLPPEYDKSRFPGGPLFGFRLEGIQGRASFRSRLTFPSA